MPINVLGNSFIVKYKIDRSSIVQKPYLRSNYIRSNTEEDIEKEKQFKI